MMYEVKQGIFKIKYVLYDETWSIYQIVFFLPDNITKDSLPLQDGEHVILWADDKIIRCRISRCRLDEGDEDHVAFVEVSDTLEYSNCKFITKDPFFNIFHEDTFISAL